MTERVLVCASCAESGQPPQGRAFARDLSELVGPTVDVCTVDCLNHCGAPIAMALQGDNKAVLLFAGVDPARDLADAEALVRLYRAAPEGEITDARPAGRLRHCLIGKVPALVSPPARGRRTEP